METFIFCTELQIGGKIHAVQKQLLNDYLSIWLSEYALYCEIIILMNLLSFISLLFHHVKEKHSVILGILLSYRNYFRLA